MIAALILAGIAEFQSQRADSQRQKSEVNQVKSLSLTAKALLNSGNQVEALNSNLEANKKLIELRDNLDAETRIKLSSSVLENFHKIRVYNHLIGHDAAVNSVAFSNDGRFLVSGSQDNAIKIWRRYGKLLQTLVRHNEGIFSVIFSPDNQYLTAASFDNTVSLWQYNLTTGLFIKNPVVTISEPEGLWAVAVNFKNNIIATGNKNGQVKLWTFQGKLIKTISAHNQKIWSLNFSPDGKYLATASADNTIKIWNSRGKFLKTLRGHQEGVLSVNFSPDSKYIVSGSEDETVRLWDLTGKLLHTFTFEGHTNEFLDVAESGYESRFRDVALQHLQRSFDNILNPIHCLNQQRQVLDVRFSPNGKLIASASADDTVRVWDIGLKRQIYHNQGYGGGAIEVSFSPDGKTLATASADKTIKLSYLKGILPKFTGNSLSFSPDRKNIAIANYKKIILRRSDGSLIREFKPQDAEIVKIKFSPTGKYLITIDKDNQIKVWNLQGKLLQKWSGHDLNKDNPMDSDAIQDIDISPDGKIISTISRVDKQVKLWNLQGKLIISWQLKDDFVTSIKFSPDGENLVVAEDINLTLWNLKGNLLRTITGHKDSISAFDFSSDGKIIATASNDKTVKLWQSDTGKLLQTLAHQDNVYAVTFSADNQFLMTGSIDEKLNLWSLSGKLINSIEAHQGSIKEIEFSRDNNIFASVDMKDNVILWNFDIEKLQQQGCNWLRNYLNTNVDLDDSQRRVCD